MSDARAPQISGVVRTHVAITAAPARRACAMRIIGPGDFPSVALPSCPEIPLAPYRRLWRPRPCISR